MSLTKGIYGQRHNGLAHGDVFTSPRVVSFMLDLIGYTPDTDLSHVRILEPCFGYGEFLAEIQRRIILSSEIFGFDAVGVMSNNVYACEIDKSKYDSTTDRLRLSMPDFNPRHFKNRDFLLTDWDFTFDYIIGNPPYVRYEKVPKDKIGLYRDKFATFHYRCDLYVLFFEQSLRHLSSGGKHCFICSNRWLKNEYGKKLRRLISQSFNLEYLLDIENINAFQEDVLAYPAITVIANNISRTRTKVARIDHIEDLKLPLDSYSVLQGDAIEGWNDVSFEAEVSALRTIEDQGFNIGIGVATGADRIFISTSLPDMVERELLMPIINARDLRGDDFQWGNRYLLNPYGPNGSLIDLSDYPRALNYLSENRAALEERHIVRNNRAWYSLIDRVKPTLLGQPKILLPDISGNNVLFVDDGRFYPAHNLYYITGKPYRELILLAAVLMSSYVKAQMGRISNRMNGGYLRWQSQSLKRLRLPVLSVISSVLRSRLFDAYQRRDLSEIDKIVAAVVSGKGDGELSYMPQRSLFDFNFAE